MSKSDNSNDDLTGWNVRSDADDAKHGVKREDSGSAGETDSSTCPTFGARTDTDADGIGTTGGGEQEEGRG